MAEEAKKLTICNLCGYPCGLECSTSGQIEDHRAGLQNAEVSGGYHSTPGNGDGALDDMTRYEFSLCEFCLDWLFSQFTVPVKMSFYDTGEVSEEAYRPAHERVREDEWRRMKQEFFAEFEKRNKARNQSKI